MFAKVGHKPLGVTKSVNLVKYQCQKLFPHRGTSTQVFDECFDKKKKKNQNNNSSHCQLLSIVHTLFQSFSTALLPDLGWSRIYG